MMAKGLRISFINVGYGEALLLESEIEGRPFRALIDGGSAEAEEFSDRSSGRIPLAEYFSKQGISELDLMICTHIHEDHVAGLWPLLKNCKVKAFWQSYSPSFYTAMRPLDLAVLTHPSRKKFAGALNAYREVCLHLAAQNVEIKQLSAGDVFELFSGLSLKVLAPSAERMKGLEEELRRFYTELPEMPEREERLQVFDGAMNNYSLLLRLDYGEMRVLLPGDTNRDGYAGLEASELKARLFKLGHHGQADGLNSKLLTMIAPDYVVCCASSDRRYRSADPELLSMIADSGAQLFYSDTPPVAAHLQAAPAHEVLHFDVSASGAVEAHYS